MTDNLLTCGQSLEGCPRYPVCAPKMDAHESIAWITESNPGTYPETHLNSRMDTSATPQYEI